MKRTMTLAGLAFLVCGFGCGAGPQVSGVSGGADGDWVIEFANGNAWACITIDHDMIVTASYLCSNDLGANANPLSCNCASLRPNGVTVNLWWGASSELHLKFDGDRNSDGSYTGQLDLMRYSGEVYLTNSGARMRRP